MLIMRFQLGWSAMTSYCEFASASHGSICGCVAITWKDSMNASWATFQLHGSTLAMCSDLYRSWRGQM
ncbi:hypothetical protein SALBM311S_11890 [Streptomyces alboniger]